ncbi:uncharacterized protein FOMMEDRAFT_144286 [Fomitiporia mediterranea MF3/22]|uniref:uncharacterized protein n=1 Tax=Fomitiporia mediterranea (strain MF3/22) TaxID=694068 RepID=UPI00044099FB|nr:uncharacterized protein FOMMEDRAFT_144286 [Fomitiporia mediterranea MF3/22]EJD08325.1 hypothetical protein FOMMEDRAFT_144286 [Fomitiporia mediterranea MF3/22]
MSTPSSFSESGHAGVSSCPQPTMTKADECRHPSVNAPTGWELYLPWLAQRPTGTLPNQSRDPHSGGKASTRPNGGYESPSYSTYVFKQLRRSAAAGTAASPALSSGFEVVDIEYIETPDLPTFSPACNRAVQFRARGLFGLGLFNVPQLDEIGKSAFCSGEQ